MNQEQWIKVLASPEVEAIITKEHVRRSSNFVFKIDENSASKAIFIESFVGVVIDNTLIEKIRFQYLGSTEVCQGQLLKLKVGSRSVYYQILEGIIKTEALDNKDETSMAIGEAFQLGEWIEERCCFEQFGWIPEISTPVFKASRICSTPDLDVDECIVGQIPNTDFDVIMNRRSAITHHMAILGVTGSGKSVYARQVIKNYLELPDVKVICVDFTGEYSRKFCDLAPFSFGGSEAAALIEDIHRMFEAVDKNYGRENQAYFDIKSRVLTVLMQMVETFLLQEHTNIAIFELPDMENTSAVMVYVQMFFKAIFEVAKKTKNYGKLVSLVLEEAHTVIPEWNFSGVNEKFSQPVLNSIAQIALKGRKYNIGLLVIAQRSAIVSKTILTQCNSIVAFQGFDKTSSDFLASYFGAEVASSISRLKFRQAYVVGKAFRSSIPMLFEVPFIQAEQEQMPVQNHEALFGGVLRTGTPFSIAYPTPRTVDPTATTTDV